MKDFTVSFPGDKRVVAHYDGRTVETDQSLKNGGKGLAPEPFDLFLVSMASCVGIYVLEFCHTRNLNTDGLGVRLRSELDPDLKLFSPIHIEVALPHDFPEKYRKAILKTANLCTVKKHIVMPTEFKVVLRDREVSEDGPNGG
ncbi:MAG: OsmC family protein [Kiritimatiellae bacterium]|nr:OsmC family protein [Kiritimatiellia bacterium]